MSKRKSTWINAAIKKAGNKSKFAESLGISPSFVSHILAGRRPFPARKAILAEQLYGVSRSVIAPEFYPPESVPAQ